jgi:hypothetical protein
MDPVLQAFIERLVQLTAAETVAISSCFHPVTLRKGRFLVRKGEKSDRIAARLRNSCFHLPIQTRC